jgi:peroxiredoxin
MKHTFKPVLAAMLVTMVGHAGTVPEFVAKKLDGSVFKSSDVVGKRVMVVDFWATWCAPCTKMLKKLQTIHETHPDVLVLAVSIDDASSMAKVSQFIQGRGYTFPVLLDPESSILRMFNPSMDISYTVIIDKNGEIAYRHSGYVLGDEKALVERLDALK